MIPPKQKNYIKHTRHNATLSITSHEQGIHSRGNLLFTCILTILIGSKVIIFLKQIRFVNVQITDILTSVRIVLDPSSKIITSFVFCLILVMLNILSNIKVTYEISILITFGLMVHQFSLVKVNIAMMNGNTTNLLFKWETLAPESPTITWE